MPLFKKLLKILTRFVAMEQKVITFLDKSHFDLARENWIYYLTYKLQRVLLQNQTLKHYITHWIHQSLDRSVLIPSLPNITIIIIISFQQTSLLSNCLFNLKFWKREKWLLTSVLYIHQTTPSNLRNSLISPALKFFKEI